MISEIVHPDIALACLKRLMRIL